MATHKAPRLIPMFGVAPHVPSICGDPDANPEGATDPRKGGPPGVAPRPKRKKRRQPKVSGPCPTCGGGIKEGSDFVCMSCYAVAPDKVAAVGRHFLPALDYDRRKGDGIEKQAAKMKADRKKAVRLTKKERKALMADGRSGEHPLPIVVAFLASQESPTLPPAA